MPIDNIVIHTSRIIFCKLFHYRLYTFRLSYCFCYERLCILWLLHTTYFKPEVNSVKYIILLQRHRCSVLFEKCIECVDIIM